jgi:hypothetical protein
MAAVCAATFSSFCAESDSGLAAGSYQIRNCKFDKLLRPENANNADGTPIVLYSAEPWKCMTWKLRPAGNSTFQLQNHFTNKTFETKTNDAQPVIVQAPFDRESSKRPLWSMVKLTGGFYRIVETKSGGVLTGTKGGVTLAPWEEKQEQQWELIETDPAQLTM